MLDKRKPGSLLCPLLGAIVLCLAAGGRSGVAEGARPVIPDEVKDHIRKRVHAPEAFGIVIGVVSPGGTAYFCHGAAEKDGPKLDEDSVFEIGSITKAFTAMLLADAAIRGELKLDDPIREHLPESVKVPSHGGKATTLEHLATHRSGLPRLPGNLMPKDADNPYADYTSEKLYEFLAECTLSDEPGERYAYSNLGAGLLGHVLSVKAGKSYDDLVRERLCVPLGMKHTGCALCPEMKQRLARGHSGDKSVSNWDLDALAGAGALRSTARDMTTFLSACAGIASDKMTGVMAMCLERRYPTGMADIEVALGWHTSKKHGSELIWHNGGTGGYHSFCGFRPDTKLGVVVLTNTSEDIDDIGMHLLEPKSPLATVRSVGSVDRATLDDYIGAYQLAPGVLLQVTREGDGLQAQLTGQDTFPIYPESKDKFFYKVVDAQLSFVRDGDGKVSKVILHQNGIDQIAEKLPPGQEPKARAEIKVDPALLKRYVGKYQLAPGFVFDVRLDGEQLTVQLTGQQRFPVFAESETKFFYKVVEAQITFHVDSGGPAGSLTLHQGGRDQRATRLPD